jgi:RHS repeat-associated protein
MAGISSKAGGNAPLNSRKFNDETELNSDLGLELYETPFRGYDPQIGRFQQVDLLAEIFRSLTPYVFAYNHPTRFNDPSGLASIAPPNLTPLSPPDDLAKGRSAPSLIPPLLTPPTLDTDSEEQNSGPQIVNFFVFESGPLATPQTFKHIQDAFNNGAPSLLTYNGGGVASDENRDMNGGVYSVGKSKGIYPCFPGYWIDEYPFACTEEGGASSWLSVRCVPANEQRMQGWMLSGTIRANNLRPGDKLNVVLIGGDNPVMPDLVPIYAPKRIMDELTSRLKNYQIQQQNLSYSILPKRKDPAFLIRMAGATALGVLFIVQPELAPIVLPRLGPAVPAF